MKWYCCWERSVHFSVTHRPNIQSKHLYDKYVSFVLPLVTCRQIYFLEQMVLYREKMASYQLFKSAYLSVFRGNLKKITTPVDCLPKILKRSIYKKQIQNACRGRAFFIQPPIVLIKPYWQKFNFFYILSDNSKIINVDQILFPCDLKLFLMAIKICSAGSFWNHQPNQKILSC